MFPAKNPGSFKNFPVILPFFFLGKQCGEGAFTIDFQMQSGRIMIYRYNLSTNSEELADYNLTDCRRTKKL